MTEFDPSSFNLAAYVLGAASRQPDKVAMAILGPANAERWSYARLEAAVRGTATGLLDAGAEPGDRILLRLGNTADFPIAFLGAIAAGLVPVPTSSQLTAAEIDVIAKMIRPKMVLWDGVCAVPRSSKVIGKEKLRDWNNLSPSAYVMDEVERPGFIVFTSGTGGRPRAVVHAHRSILARRMMFDGWYGLGPEDRVMHAGAFNWTYTLGTGLLDPWTIGATALIPAAGLGVSALPLLLKRHDASIFAAAPGVYRQLLRQDIPPLPKLRHGLSAGEKLPEILRTRWRDATGTDIHEAFGMSECSTFISGSPLRPAPAGTLGFAQPGRRIALLDDTGQEADHGIIAIHRSDPGLMLGYLDDPTGTESRFSGDWFLTGDAGARSLDGAIMFEGRSADIINAGGYRVSPIEVENTMLGHPAITEVAVVQVQAREDTSLMVAFYCAPDPIDAAALQAFASRALARYKVPHIFVHTKTLPRGTNNKLLRRKLARQWEADHGQA